MAQKIGHLLNQALQGKSEIARQLRATIILETSQNVLAEILGSDDHLVTRPLSFRNGTLKIKCRHSVCSQEIQLREGEIIAEINRRLGGQQVCRLLASA